MTTPVAAPDLAPGLERCFFFDATEHSYDISGATGRVPAWLRGTYYVNGPARFERGGSRYRHWLDGDGMVSSLRFTREGVRFTNRFVRTRKWLDEESAGRFLYRGFGTAFSGDRLRRNVMVEPPVNVSVYAYAGTLLAFGEQTLPMELDPVTLETRGEYDFHGRLNEVTPFAAHAKYDGHLVNFGVSFSPTQPMLNVYEFDGAGELLRRARHPLKFQHSLHDFAITPRHSVFFLSPLLMNFERFWAEGASVMESLSWEPEKGSSILVAPRPAGGSREPAFTVEAGSGYCLHVINCFEDGDRMALDVIELEEPVYREYQPIPDLFATVSSGRPVRYWIDCGSQTVLDRIALAYDRTPDFPAINPARTGASYEDFWMLGIGASGQRGRKFFNQLAHGNWRAGEVSDVWQAPAGEYLGGEPVYVEDPGKSGEAVVVVEHLDPHNEAAFLLFDAFAVRNGPIARLPLRQPLHPGFHASFCRTMSRSS